MYKIIFLFFFMLTTFVRLESQSLTKLTGLVYYDYYYNFLNKDVNKRDLNGFQFRRVFLTLDFDVSNKLSARFRLEPEYQGDQSNNKQFVFLKDMYFQYKFNSQQIFAGLMPTPNFEFEEKYWGYRSVEKTQSELREWVSIRDLGFSIKNYYKGSVNYAIMFANNSFYGTETNKYKKIYFHVNSNITNDIAISFDFNFANHEHNKNVIYSKYGLYRSTVKYSGGLTVVGGIRFNHLANNKELYEYGFSIFSNYKLTDQIKTFLRIDIYEPNVDIKNDSEITMISGVDYRIERNLFIIPNLIFNKYENNTYQSDLTARITFHYQF